MTDYSLWVALWYVVEDMSFDYGYDFNCYDGNGLVSYKQGCVILGVGNVTTPTFC